MRLRALLPKIVAIGLIGIATSQYLAGFGFLVWIQGNVRDASPLTIARYAYCYGDDPDLRRGLVAFSLGGLCLVAAMLAVAFWPKPRSLHGDARFATRSEIKSAKLLGKEGIVLGRLGSRYVLLAGQQGVALAAPPRAGKGAGVVIPNALHWPGSLVCVDIKRENWTVTAGYRAACGQACYLFDPLAEDGRTVRWNPFAYVSPDLVLRVNDLQRIAEMLYPDPGGEGSFWAASARSVFLGIALYLFETPSLPCTIGEVLRQGMATIDEGFVEHWKRVIEGRNAHGNPLSPECVRTLRELFDLHNPTASSIRKTFTSRLDLWQNPILDAATAGNDFDLRELRKKPMSIYLAVNPDDLQRLRPVLSLFLQQAIGLQTRELPEHNPALKYQVMMLLDEFTALGEIPIIAKAISYLPGYNVRTVLVIQAPAQLREVYGMHNAETMLKSLAARIVFAPKDFPDAKEISDELGNQTVKVKSLSKPMMSFGDGKGARSRSVTISEQRRPLLLPQEVKELPAHEQIIFCEGLRPIRCQKIRYFEDPIFKQRLRSPPPRPKALALKRAEMPQPVSKTAARSRSEESMRVSTVERAATPNDITRLNSIRAENIVMDMNLDLFAGRLPDTPLTVGERAQFTGLFMGSVERAQRA